MRHAVRDGGASTVSRSPGRPEGKIMAIVTACSALGLAVSEKKMEAICLQPNICGESDSHLRGTGSQAHKRTIEFVYLGRSITLDREVNTGATQRFQGSWPGF